MASGGTVLSIEVAGGAAAAKRFCDACRVARIAISLGGPETLLSHAATIATLISPAERADLGITDGLVRISVGLEHPDDLIADFDEALAAAAG
jgi:cystathionine beta-lyase/cystathionine gamma-synthase